jgi:diguanylate cyclase (GGDEF)-like protein
VVVVIAVAFGAAFGIDSLRMRSDMARRSQTVLADIEAGANNLAAADWEAAASRGTPAGLIEEARATQSAIRVELDQLRGLGGDQRLLVEIDGAAERYLAAVTTELGLYEAGSVVKAREVDESQVDPQSTRLHGFISQARSRANERAASSSRGARVGALALLLFAAILIGGLFRRHERTRRVARQAFEDPLTGLANRRLFADRLSQRLTPSGAERTPFALLYIDLDNFKSLNDGYGHSTGDELLERVARRLEGAARPADSVARLGGDEFAVLVPGVSDEAACERITARFLAALGEPFAIGGRQLTIEATVGYALAGGDESPDELLRNADLAMYAAKRLGKGRAQAFHPSMHTAMVEQVALEQDLRVALERGELSLAYQPIIDIDSDTIVGVESLCRWQHPKRGLIPPATFIPLAEESGQIVPLGRWVLNETCRQVKEWQQQQPLFASVNVSVVQLDDTDLVDDVARALADTGLAPQSLLLEVTETALSGRPAAAAATLMRLTELGVRVAIDDFGAGHSSLARLRSLHANVLKIDRSFINDMLADPDAAIMVRSVVDLAESLGLTVVAEGIERAEQLTALRALGCDLAQGYHLGVPMPTDAFSALLNDAAQASTR